MMSAQDTEVPEVSVPASVTSPRAKLVYLYLDRAGAATASEVAERLDLGKLAVYGVLGALDDRGLVEEVDGRYRLR